MYIDFKRLLIQGFLSIANEEVSLADQGLVLIMGINEHETHFESNGSGKSSILEAIVWVLTGKTPRGTTDVVNRHWEEGYCLVECDFTIEGIEYTVRRTVNHPDHGSGISMWKDGQDISGRTKTASKEVLENEIPYITYDGLISIILLSQGLPGRLSSLPPAQRKSRLEELSRTEYIYQDVNDRVSTLYNEYTKELNEAEKNLVGINVDLKNKEDLLKSKQDELNNLKNTSLIDDDLADFYRRCIDDGENMLLDITGRIGGLRQEKETIGYEMGEKNTDLGKYTNEYNSILKDYNSLSEGESIKCSHCGISECPVCGASLWGEHDIQSKKDDLSTRLQGISDKIESTRGYLLSLDERVRNIDSEMGVLEGQRDIINNKKHEVNAELYKYDRYLDDVKKYEEEIKGYEEARKDILQRLDEENKRKVDAEKNLEICKYLKNNVMKKFKGFLLQSVIDYINLKARSGSMRLFTERDVYLNLRGNNLDIKLGDTMFENLSGGERRRADLILQLAQRDLAKNERGFSSNILSLDEVLDGLDDVGINTVLDMLYEKSREVESMFVVSHKELRDVGFDYKWVVTKGTDELSRISYI